jgi:hypothetical protein
MGGYEIKFTQAGARADRAGLADLAGGRRPAGGVVTCRSELWFLHV